MNWTEGSLARHSRGRGWNEDAARQKQYFAKARARKHDLSASQKTMHHASFVPDHILKTDQVRGCRKLASPSLQQPINLMKRPRSQRGDQRDARAVTRDAASLQSSNSPSTQESINIDLDSKRRRLLEKSDWTGVGFQKPISIGFASRGDVAGNLLSGYDSNLTQNYRGWTQRTHRGRTRTENTAKKANINKRINIRIGDRDFQWSHDNNSIQSPTSYHAPLPTFEAWTSRRKGSTTPQSSFLSSPNGGTLAHVSSFHSRHSLAPSCSSWDRRQAPSSASNTDSSSDRCTSGRRDQPKYVVQSSPQFIHQPQPTRGRATALFDYRSPTPDETSSTVAQIGSLRGRGSRHITTDDDVWDIWLNSNNDNEPRNHFDVHDENAPSPSITPGPSHYHDGLDEQPPAPLQCETGGEGDLQTNTSEQFPEAFSASPKVSSRRSNSVLVQFELGPSKLAQERDGPISETRPETVPPKRKVSSICGWSEKSTNARKALMLPSNPELPKPPDVQDLMDLLMDEDGTAGRNITPDEASGDEDEIWKKFVFDGDTTELSRRARVEARQQTAHRLYLARADTRSGAAEPPASLRENPSRSPAPVGALGSNYSENSRSPKMVSHTADPTEMDVAEVTNSHSAHQRSPRLQHTDFKFHQPRLFVGRLASLPSGSVDPRAAHQQQMCNKTKGGRRQWRRRRRAEGRPDFRAMPDYEGDPIEECYLGEG